MPHCHTTVCPECMPHYGTPRVHATLSHYGTPRVHATLSHYGTPRVHATLRYAQSACHTVTLRYAQSAQTITPGLGHTGHHRARELYPSHYHTVPLVHITLSHKPVVHITLPHSAQITHQSLPKSSVVPPAMPWCRRWLGFPVLLRELLPCYSHTRVQAVVGFPCSPT